MRRSRSLRRTTTVALGVFVLGFLASQAAGQGLPAGTGAVIAVGGGLSQENGAVYRAILEAREGTGPLCVVGTASADPEPAAARGAAAFDRWGGPGTALAIPLAADEPDRAGDSATLEALANCSGYFFTGGVQSRIVELLRPGGAMTAAGQVIQSRWRAGAVVAGSSAGAAMLSDPMIAGGAPGGRFAGTGEGVRRSAGMGFLPEILVDQHFLARGRIGRLVEAMLDPDAPLLAAGVDEDTALVVRGDTLEVVGRSGVILLDRRMADEGAAPALRLELLGPGDRLALGPGEDVLPAPDRRPLPALDTDRFEGPEGGIFERWVFLRFLEGKSRAELRWGGGTSTLRVPDGNRFRLTVLPGFRALGAPGGEGEGVAGSHDGLSAGPLSLQVLSPIPNPMPGGLP